MVWWCLSLLTRHVRVVHDRVSSLDNKLPTTVLFCIDEPMLTGCAVYHTSLISDRKIWVISWAGYTSVSGSYFTSFFLLLLVTVYFSVLNYYSCGFVLVFCTSKACRSNICQLFILFKQTTLMPASPTKSHTKQAEPKTHTLRKTSQRIPDCGCQLSCLANVC